MPEKREIAGVFLGGTGIRVGTGFHLEWGHPFFSPHHFFWMTSGCLNISLKV